MANEKKETGITKRETSAVAAAGDGDVLAMLKGLGMSTEDVEGFQQTQMGGVSRWLNLKAFMVDPNAPQNKPVKGTGKAFAGLLLGRQEIEVDDEEAGEVNADGVKVRHFYTLKLMSTCPVTYKGENNETIEAVAQVGDIISVGERHALRRFRELTDNGGLYAVIVKPDSRIGIGRGQTMWTFAVWEKVIRPPVKVKAELVTKTPF